MSNEEATRLLNEYEGAGEYLKLLAEGVGGRIRGKAAAKPKTSQQTGSPSTLPKRLLIKDVTRDLEVLNELLSPNDRAPKRTHNPITAEEWVSFYNSETGKLRQSQTQLYVLIFMRVGIYICFLKLKILWGWLF
jgi:hypothetical protein